MRKTFTSFIENELDTDCLLITCGLPATAKSGLAEVASRVRGYPLLSSDLIRLEVLREEDIFNEKTADNMDKRMMVYEEIFRRADEVLSDGGGVVLDATFVTRQLRQRAAAIATKYSLPLVIMETVCPQAAALRRIRSRTRENYESNAITERAYLNNKEAFEAVDTDGLKREYPELSIVHLRVDTQDDGPEKWYITGEVRQ